MELAESAQTPRKSVGEKRNANGGTAYSRNTDEKGVRGMEQVRFFPNDAAYKQPMGAIEAGETLKLHMKFNRPSNPSEVF